MLVQMRTGGVSAGGNNIQEQCQSPGLRRPHGGQEILYSDSVNTQHKGHRENKPMMLR